MSSKNRVKRRKLSSGIALLYAVIYITSSFVAFSVFYIIISSSLNREVNEDMISDVKELEILLKEEGLENLVKEINNEAESDGYENAFFRIFSADSQIIAETDLDKWPGLKTENRIMKEILSEEKESYRIISYNLPGKEYEVRTIYSVIASEYIIQIGLVLENTTVFLSMIRNIFIFLVVIIVAFSAFIALFISRRALKGIEEVTRTAEDISESGSLERRVSIKTPYDEISNLAKTFNTMLNSIQRLVNELKEINENIAHDIKAPITRIRGHAEVTLTSSVSTIEDYENMASNTIEESDNLLEIITSMLYISRVDSGIATVSREEIDLSEITMTACELFFPVAENRGISINMNIEEDCFFYGEKKGIQRMIANLMDNAIKYSREGGLIDIDLEKTENGIIFKISDNGIGIDQDKTSLIFKRFYRCPENTGINGIGLGLSMVNAVVKQHSGTINVNSVKGSGTVFTVYLPLIHSDDKTLQKSNINIMKQ